MKIKVWFMSLYHTDSHTLEYDCPDNFEFEDVIDLLKNDGGFMFISSFIPYHAILRIDQISE